MLIGEVILKKLPLDVQKKIRAELEIEAEHEMNANTDDHQAVNCESTLNILANQILSYENELSEMTRELMARYEEQVFLYDVAGMLNVEMSIEEISRTILSRIIELFEASSGSVMLIEKDKLQLNASIGYEPFHMEFKLNEGIAGTVAVSGRLEIVNEPSSDERFTDGTSNINSLLCAPITSSGKIIGVLNINDREGGFTAGDGKIARTVAEFAGMFIDNARLNREKLEENRIRDRLSRYLSPYIVNELVKEGGLSLGGHKSQVTVMFTDIRGFTAMSERMNPADIVSQLNEYFTEMVDIVFQHGGTLDKFVGDMIMALFGAPVADEKSESRAISAAIDMTRRLHELNEKWHAEGKERFHVGIGIHSGEAIVGNIGSPRHMDFTAIGDSVNIAQRIESQAHGGEILVSRDVYDRQKNNFTMEAAGMLSVKGKSQPIESFRVIWDE